MKILRSAPLCLFAVVSAFGWADQTYLGIYISGQKIGYTSSSSVSDKLNGKAVTRNDSSMIMDAGLLGQALRVRSDSTTWIATDGKPLKMRFVNESAGRKQTVVASFSQSTITATIDNSGTVTKRTLTIPLGAEIVDDPTMSLIQDSSKIGKKRDFYMLDPTTVSLIKNQEIVRGKAQTTVKGKPVDATLMDIVDPRFTTKVFFSAKGDLIKIVSIMGIEMLPESREVAMSMSTGGYTPVVDLAAATKLKSDKEIGDPRQVSFLKLQIAGVDLSSIPSGDHQDVAKSEGGFAVAIHPPQYANAAKTLISTAAAQKPDWIKPGLHIPSDAASFKALAKQTVGDTKTVVDAALRIRRFVYSEMKPNAGIGVLRDATEIWKSKEGVCRDYAILTATLMRSAGIPARLCSGLVNWEGEFYYHAWVEVWNSDSWIGIDSTEPVDQISAAHVKLGEGNVEQAFNFKFLDGAKVQVLEFKRR